MRSEERNPGIAVYFTLRGKQMAMARDCYDNTAQNLRSLGMAVEHLRGLERHGGAQMLERAFAGFAQLPPPGGSADAGIVDWRKELGLGEIASGGLAKSDLLVLAEARYREKAKLAHPDQGGDAIQMIRLNMAIKQARDELK